jgi:probable F420-dependent oxidoreductase
VRLITGVPNEDLNEVPGSVIRAIWRARAHDEPLEYEGEHYQFTLMTPNFTPEPLTCALPRITIAAVGPAMMKVAATECDGVRLHGFCTRAYLETVALPRLEAALVTAGRPREAFEISGGGFVATGATEAAVARALEWVRLRVRFYGSTRTYWPVLEAHGLEDLGAKLNHMSRTDQWDAMAGEISDDVVRLFAAVGRHDELAAALARCYGGLVDSIGVGTPVDEPGGLPPDLIADIHAIPSRFLRKLRNSPDALRGAGPDARARLRFYPKNPETPAPVCHLSTTCSLRSREIPGSRSPRRGLICPGSACLIRRRSRGTSARCFIRRTPLRNPGLRDLLARTWIRRS